MALPNPHERLGGDDSEPEEAPTDAPSTEDGATGRSRASDEIPDDSTEPTPLHAWPSDSAIDVAKHLQELGLAPFPCRGKKPDLPHGHYTWQATPAGRWTFAADQNVGIDLPLGTVVLDIDNPERFAELGLEVPPTVNTATQTPGNSHHYYRTEPGRTVKQIQGGPDGYDTRVGGKGYVIAWRPYELLPVEEWAMAPEWMYHIGEKAKDSHSKSQDTNPDDGIVPPGTRDNWLTSQAGRFRRMGMDEQEIYEGLRALRNRVPSKNDKDFQRIARSVSHYEAGDPGYATARPEPTPHVQSTVPKSIAWIWPKRLGLGKFTMLDGDPDVGKSMVILDIALRCARGNGIWPDTGRDQWIDNGLDLGPRDSIIFSTEDDWEDTMLPRLIAMNATPEQIARIHHNPVPCSLPHGMDDMLAFIRAKNVVFVAWDPLTAYVDAQYDIGKSDQDTRGALEPLVQLLREELVAGWGNRHTNKKEGARALDKGTGSRAVGAIARVNLMAGRNPNNPDYRVLAPVKANLTGTVKGLSYRLLTRPVEVQHVLTGKPVSEDYPYVSWEGETTVTADQVVAGPRKPKVANLCAQYIEEVLEDAEDGEMLSTELLAMCLTAGYSKNAYDDARHVARIKSEQREEGHFWTVLA